MGGELLNVIKSQDQMSVYKFVVSNYPFFILNFKDYGVYLEDNGHTLRGLFIIDDKGTLRQVNKTFFTLKSIFSLIT